MSLAYFPYPHDDESLYSVIARFGRHVGLGTRGDLAQVLFGSRHVVASVDLPCRLAHLAERIGAGGGMDLDRLIDRHTSLPYHAAFQSTGDRQAAREAMAGDGQGRHFRLGVAGPSARAPARLRFCPSCLSDMLRLQGEPYWRRSHHLPGVMVCPDHGFPLRESTVDLAGVPRHAFVAATVRTCPDDTPEILPQLSAVATERLLLVSRASRDLLSTAPRDSRDGIADEYRAGLSRLGLMRSDHKVDVAALEDAIGSFYGDVLMYLPMPTSGLEWVFRLLRTGRTASPSLQHVVLRSFLEGAERKDADRDEAPWKCPNPLAEHHGRRVVTDVQQRKHAGVVTGTFTCSCGYVFRKRLEGRAAVGPTLFKAYGPTLVPAVRRMVAEGGTQRGVAKAVGLDVKTLNRQVAALGITVPWAHDGHSPTAASRIHQSHGGDATNAGCKPTGAPIRRVQSRAFDWAAKDEVMTGRIPGIVAGIRAMTPARRVTVTEIERQLGRGAWLKRQRGRLPRTDACVEALTETVEQFRQRRIETCVRSLVRAKRERVAWRVMRSVGLDGRYLPSIEHVIASIRDEASTAMDA